MYFRMFDKARVPSDDFLTYSGDVRDLDKQYLTPLGRAKVKQLTRGLYNYSDETASSLLKLLFGKPHDITKLRHIDKSLNEEALELIFLPSCRSQANIKRLRLGSILRQLDKSVLGWLTALDYATATNVLLTWGFFHSQSSFKEKAKILYQW